MFGFRQIWQILHVDFTGIEISGKQVDIEIKPITTTPRSVVFDNARMRTLLLDVETPLRDGLAAEWGHMKSIHHNV